MKIIIEANSLNELKDTLESLVMVLPDSDKPFPIQLLDLDIPISIVNKLEKEGIINHDQLRAYLKQHSRFTGIRGIGVKADTFLRRLAVDPHITYGSVVFPYEKPNN